MLETDELCTETFALDDIPLTTISNCSSLEEMCQNAKDELDHINEHIKIVHSNTSEFNKSLLNNVSKEDEDDDGLELNALGEERDVREEIQCDKRKKAKATSTPKVLGCRQGGSKGQIFESQKCDTNVILSGPWDLKQWAASASALVGTIHQDPSQVWEGNLTLFPDTSVYFSKEVSDSPHHSKSLINLGLGVRSCVSVF